MKTKCEYCSFDEFVGKTWDDNKYGGSPTHLLVNTELQEVYVVNADYASSAPINYCPMCGRKLSED